MAKKPVVYAFIDSQNLNLGVANDVFHRGKKVYTGWSLDFKKFRRYLKDKHKVEVAFLFIGNLPGNEGLYEYLQRAGYVLILKPTTSYKDSDGSVRVKGNVDTDIVLYAAAKEIDSYDKAVIVTGDGDFLSLCTFLDEHGKLGRICIPNKLRHSQLLDKYVKYFDFISVNRAKLEKDHRVGHIKKTSIISSDAHGEVTRHCDTASVAKNPKKVNNEGTV
jgi:uncharacterized LabA/DUF88 family protein